jgi:hypothetical protein
MAYCKLLKITLVLISIYLKLAKTRKLSFFDRISKGVIWIMNEYSSDIINPMCALSSRKKLMDKCARASVVCIIKEYYHATLYGEDHLHLYL